MSIKLYPPLAAYLEKVFPIIDEIEEDRKEKLDVLSGYIAKKDGNVKLIFICTHNSRRSHLTQIWAKVAAEYYNLDVDTWSGGTEATAFNPRAVASLERAGFSIENPGGDNPRYQVSYSTDKPALVCFSKVFDDPENPSNEFAAVMTCTDAEQNCPFVPGTEKRISLPYRDPKEADNTPQEKERYDERSFQIASEMFYVFGKAAAN